MAINLLNLAVNATAVSNKMPSTVTKAIGSGIFKKALSSGLTSDPGANLNLDLGKLTDDNSKFLATMVTATDPNINAVQALVDSAKASINPKLANAVSGFDATSVVSSMGLSALQGKLPSLNDVIGSQFGNLGIDQVAKRVGYATNVALPGLPTSISNITSPLSNVLNSVGAASPLMNTVSSFNTLKNANSPIGKINAGLNLVNSAKQLSKSNPQDIVKGLASNAISNAIGNKLNVLNNVGGLLGNVTSLGKSLSDFSGSQNIKLFDPSDWINPDIESLATQAFADIENLANDLTSNFNIFDSVLTSQNIPKKVGSDGSRKLGNVLREYNTYNYILTLGILSPNELNFPESYVKNGMKHIICKSAGGTGSNPGVKRQRTASEDALGADLEYFIDNLSIDSVVNANPNTGVTLGTSISFDIIEPYSMGQFLEVIRESAAELGFGNFQNLPFCVKIEFTGYDAFGKPTQSVAAPSYLPIKINNIDFEIDGEGSRYSVSAVIYTELAFEDSVDIIMSDVSASGKRVHEVLETGENSITTSVNALFERAENNNLISGYDRYVILFPKDSADVSEALKGISVTSSELQTFNEEESQRRESVSYDPRDETQGITVNRSASNATKYYRNLKIWGSRPENINAIGLSLVVDDVARQKNIMNKAQRYELANDGPGQVEEVVLPEVGNVLGYQYKQNYRISKIIEDVCADSEYVQDAINSSPAGGLKSYYKIEQMVFIEDEAGVNPDLGRPRMTYVYCIVPSFICESKVMASKEAPTAIAERKSAADKEYNYIYSGKNEDVLDFNINFDNAFRELVLADFSKGAVSGGESGENISRTEDQAYSAGNSAVKDEAVGTTVLGTQNQYEFYNGAQKTSDPESLAKRNRAEQFHSRLINSPLNMITADLSIWGDPYYLPTDAGNSRQKLVGRTMTSDGRADTRLNELSIVINFKTPLDYPQLNGSFLMGMPELVKPFSGLYNCWGITHTFNKGQFTQNLSLQRISNQTNTPTGTGIINGTSARFIGDRLVGGL